jgi:hypothetical protein
VNKERLIFIIHSAKLLRIVIGPFISEHCQEALEFFDETGSKSYFIVHLSETIEIISDAAENHICKHISNPERNVCRIIVFG